MESKSVWDRIAPSWNKYRTKIPQTVREFLGEKHGKILDLGCGTGRNFYGPGTFYGVDFSYEMLNLAEKM